MTYFSYFLNILTIEGTPWTFCVHKTFSDIGLKHASTIALLQITTYLAWRLWIVQSCFSELLLSVVLTQNGSKIGKDLSLYLDIIVASFLGHEEFPLSFNEREEAKSLFAQINHLHKIKGFPRENLLWSLIEGRSPQVCKSEMLYQSFNRQWCKESLMMIERVSKLHVHQVKFNLSL